MAGSPAIGTGGPNVGGYELDQRGYARSTTGPISIGAYEANSPGNPFLVTSTSDPSIIQVGTLRTAIDYANNNLSLDHEALLTWDHISIIKTCDAFAYV